MKSKISLLLVGGSLLLASCGSKGTYTYEEMLQKHTEATKTQVSSLIQALDLSGKKTKISNLDLSLSGASITGEAHLTGTGNMDFSGTGLVSSSDLSITFSGATQDIQGKKDSASGNIAFTLTQNQEKFWIRLLGAKIASAANPQIEFFAGMAENALKNQWIEIPTQKKGAFGGITMIQEGIQKFFGELQKNFPFEKTKDLGFQDGWYKYSVTLSPEKLAKLVSALRPATETGTVDPSEFSALKVGGELSINEDHPEWIRADLTVAQDGKKDAPHIHIENEKNTMSLAISPLAESGSLSLSINKDKKNGTLSFVASPTEKIMAQFNFDISAKSSKVQGDIQLSTASGTTTLGFLGASSIGSFDGTIEIPKEAKTLQQVMGGMMGGALPTDDVNEKNPDFLPVK